MSATWRYNGRVLTYDEDSGKWTDVGKTVSLRGVSPSGMWLDEAGSMEVARMEAPSLDTSLSFTIKVSDIEPHVFAMLIGLGERPPDIPWRYTPEPVDVHDAHGWKELLALEAKRQAQVEFIQQHNRRSTT